MKLIHQIFNYKMVTWAIGLFSIILGLTIWSATSYYFDMLTQHKFDTNVLENMNRIDKQMSSYENALHSGIGFVQGSDYVSRTEWHRFSQEINLQKNYPGMQGLGLIKVVNPDLVHALVLKMRTDGFPTFSIKPAGKRNQYAPVLYLEPMDKRNLQAIGYDIFSEPIRRAAMQRARDTGLPSITKRIILVQEIGSDVQSGILMALPFYKTGVTLETIEDRRKALIGYVDSVFRMNDLMKQIALNDSILDFEIYDSREATKQHLLYRSFTSFEQNPSFHTQKTLQIYGQTWYLSFWSTSKFDAEMSKTYPLLFTLGGLSAYIFLVLIILYLRKGQKKLQESEQRLQTIIETEPECVKIVDKYGKLLEMNSAGLGMLEASTLKEAQAYNLVDYLLPAWRAPFIALHTQVMNGEKGILEFEIKGLKGTIRWLEIHAVPMRDAEGNVVALLGVTRDITDKKRAEADIENLAHFDQLTGLPNRALLNDRVKYLLSRAERENEPLAVIFLDLDHFKNINDSLGHTIGDKLLIEIARRIQDGIRDEDTVSRLGGDEFIILFPNTDSNSAMLIATKLITTISQPFIIGPNELIITPSIGIALYPDDGKDFETLLKNADTAMYRVKSDSRNSFHFFTQEMQEHLSRNLLLVNALRHALERNELEVYYQPQVDIVDGRIVGAEALLRWNHPELGMIPPSEFIPLAESSGQIIEIGEWVLRTATRQTKEWMERGFLPMVVAVNVSAIQFRQLNFTTLVTDILDEIGLPPEYLELELTEAVTMHNPKLAIDIMNKLHAQGVRMSIDDFGTGYSSLSYLKKFKVYKLKIDQSFIRDIATDSEDRAIVTAIIDMAGNLGLHTIAEGVETAEQLAFLRLHGCNEIQGYYFSKPLPAKQFSEFVLKEM